MPVFLSPPHWEGSVYVDNESEIWVRTADLKILPKVFARNIYWKLVILVGSPLLNIFTSRLIDHCTGCDPARDREIN